MLKRRDAETQRDFIPICANEYPVGRNITKFGLRVSASLRLISFLALISCSIPNLESAACIESRNTVREFYSLHFGNDMRFSAQNLKQRERFLTSEFTRKISNSAENSDPFTTGTSDIPKAFRVGECRDVSAERTEFQVLLFWRTDERTEQREIKVEAVKQSDGWLIDDIVSNKL